MLRATNLNGALDCTRRLLFQCVLNPREGMCLRGPRVQVLGRLLGSRIARPMSQRKGKSKISWLDLGDDVSTCGRPLGCIDRRQIVHWGKRRTTSRVLPESTKIVRMIKEMPRSVPPHPTRHPASQYRTLLNWS